MHNLIKKYLNSHFKLSHINTEELEDYIDNSKEFLLFYILLISVFMVLFFGISSFNAKVHDITIINMFSTVFFVTLIYFLVINKNLTIISILYFYFVGCYFLYFIAYGGIAKYGYVWTFLYPLATLFFFGRKKGLWFSLLFLFFATIFLFTFSIYNEPGLQFQLRYISIYSSIVLIAYSFEKTRDKLIQTVSEKNFVLREKILELEIKDKDLTIAKEKAENADKLKSEFLAQMSHEIRTPINTILNYSSLIQSEFEGKLSEDIENSFGSITKASNRLIRTIDMILNLSAIESGSYEPIYEKLYISKDIIIPLVSEFEQTAKTKNLYLIVCDGFTDEVPIKADRYTLTQAIANLIDNSIKYTKVGGTKISVKFKKEICKINIEDSGIGISPEYFPKLFEKFTQETQGYTRRYEGTGLGLTLVKKYCEVNNAKISVESTKDKGTSFKINIPIFNQK
jgi:signal transduction histidine kinase